MQGIVTSHEGSRVTIDFGSSGLNCETLRERVDEVVPLLHALLYADGVLSELPTEDLSERMIGYLAMDMVCQAAIQRAIAQAAVLREIADGSASIADHGFPEFEGGMPTDV